MDMHERRAVAKAVSGEDKSAIGDRDQRFFRVRIAARRAGRPRSGSLAQRNPPTTNRYCPHRHQQQQQQHPGWTGGRGKGETRGGEERTERRDETGLFHVEKGCVWRQRRRRRRHVDRLKGGERRRGGGGVGGERKRPVLSGAVCVCLSVCSHTVEINLPSGLSLWNKERRKLARSDTLREKWRETRQAQGRHGGVEGGA